VNNQQDYSLPTTAQRIHRVHVKDSSGNYQKLDQFDVHDLGIAPTEYYETPGMPRYYDLVGRSVLLYPAPASGYVTLSAGLQLYFDRDVTEFATTATTSEPGFATAFHRILSTAAAIDWVKDVAESKRLQNQLARLELGLTRFYGKRNVERRTTLRPSSRKKWRRYT
jgi:hypothetical protein